MAAPLLLDLSHTSHTRARTGVQRVARSLHAALDGRAVPVTYDPYRRAWRELETWEQSLLASNSPAPNRGAKWPARARWRGRLRRAFGPGPGLPSPAAGTILPEIFSAEVAAHLDVLPRPRVAVFHDAIALKLPEFTPAKTVARFPAYLRELLAFDGIAAVSDDSRTSLLDYWQWLRLRDVPPVRTIPLGIELPTDHPASADATGSKAPIVLCVGSIEGRKNHLALLEACEGLWSRGREFELHLIGLARPETAGTALARIRDLAARGRPLRHHGVVDDAALSRAYRTCAFTVYPSLLEGFGLPVLESMAHGKPCICCNHGALGEAARGGGCLTLDRVDASTLASAIELLVSDEAERTRLTKEARQRRFRSWSEYAADLTAWVAELRR